jgi:predicted Zn-dependent protease
MTTPADLAPLAVAIHRLRLRDLVDLFVERVATASWTIRGGRVTEHAAVLREGAAARRDGRLDSADGLDRTVLAGLLGIPARPLPATPWPSFVPPPAVETLPILPGLDITLRWWWTWAAVIRDGAVAEIRRPQLLEVEAADGQRRLTVWPAAPGVDLTPSPAPHAAPRPGRVDVLLAPTAATVFVHELLGHPLESDALLAGGSPWAGSFGETLLPLPLDLDDDPTRDDLPGAFTADDEGVPAAPRPLLRGGELVGALTDRAGGAAFGSGGGNARRASCHLPPRPRMSNLILGAPDGAPVPPREEARLEVLRFAAGTLEPRFGLLLLAVREGWELRRGERHRPVGGFTLVADARAARDGLVAAGGPAEASAEPGWCGKDGDVVPTGGVSPWLLVRGMEVR